MGVLLAFAPFFAFALVDRLVDSNVGLLAGAATSALLVARDAFGVGRRVKVLELGTLALFVGLALYSYLRTPGWSVLYVRLRVDAGLLALIVATLAIGQPFTLPYARERTPETVWNSPAFKRTNQVISLAWAGAFLVLVLADALMIYRPDVPQRVGILLTVAALVAAYKFTAWYPERARQAHAAA